MNCTVNVQEFSRELRLLSKIVPSKSSIPFLEHARLWAHEGGWIELFGTDIALGLKTACDATVTEAGGVTVPVKHLLTLLDRVDGGTVQILTDKHHVKIKAGSFTSRLQTLNPDDFPVIPEVPKGGITLSVPAFKSMINRVQYAIDNKSVVQGAQFTLAQHVIAMVATDNHQLPIVAMPHASEESFSLLLPRKLLDALMVMDGSDESGTVTFAHTWQHLFFTHGPRMLYSRTLEGKFPDYQRILPRATVSAAVIDKDVLLAAWWRIGAVSGNDGCITCAFSSEGLRLSVETSGLGDAEEHVPLNYTGEGVTVRLRWQHLSDFLGVATEPSITINLTNAKTPILLKDGEDHLSIVGVMQQGQT